MKRKTTALLSTAALLLTMLSGCGAGSGNSPTSSTSLSSDISDSSSSASDTEASSTSAVSSPSDISDNSSPAEESCDGKLVFDHTMELQYAKCFSVDYYKGGYKLATISDGTKLLIVPEGMSVPADIDTDTIVLQQPINNMLVSSTPVTSLINAVGALDAISLTTYAADSWYIDDVKNAINDGKIQYIGDYKEPDYEQIIAADIKFTIYSTMLTDEVAEQLKTLGIDILLDQSAEEEHPLARVEWMKLYGAMFDLEDKAEQLVNEQIKLVDEISKRESTGKSVAIFYITSKGKLYARNAGDYMAKMADLAGGKYVLSELNPDKSGTLDMEPEAFYDGAKDADYIIYIWTLGGKPETLDDFIGRSEILSEMKAVKNGNVWCTTPDFFQIQNTIGSMINDINLMLNADENTDKLTYLFKLK